MIVEKTVYDCISKNTSIVEVDIEEHNETPITQEPSLEEVVEKQQEQIAELTKLVAECLQ